MIRVLYRWTVQEGDETRLKFLVGELNKWLPQSQARPRIGRPDVAEHLEVVSDRLSGE